MSIDIDCIDQSIKIDTHNFSSPNQSIFIDNRKTFKNAYMFFILGINFSYEMKRLSLQQMDFLNKQNGIF